MKITAWQIKTSFSLIALTILTLAFFQNCSVGSSSSSSVASPESITNFVGTYTGTETGIAAGNAFNQSTTLVVTTQTGNSLAGSFNDGNGNVGTFVGTISGNELNPFVATNGPSNPCGSGTFTGSAVLNGIALTATVQGTSASCGSTVATISATLVAQSAELTLAPGTNTVAAGGNVVLTASGGVPPYIFSITNGDGSISVQSNSAVFTASSLAGIAEVKVTDSQSPPSSATSTIMVQ